MSLPKLTLLVGVLMLLPALNFAQPANDNCSNATTITLDGACTPGTTQNGSTQSGEPVCLSSGAGCNVDGSSWYRFNTGSNSTLWLDIDQTNSPNCAGGYAVYGPFAPGTGCMPSAGSEVVCENTLPSLGGTELTGLASNSDYLVQVVGRNGGGSGDRFLEYCIAVETPSGCPNCSSPCGAACGFATPPAVADVTCCCPDHTLSPHLGEGDSGSWCFTFTAINSSVDFGLIISQIGCVGGNIASMNWTVSLQGSCIGPVASGTFPTLTATGLTPGTDYTFCYTLTVAASCVHTAHWPYFVGAQQILPLPDLTFTGTAGEEDVALNWVTDIEEVSEFSVERSSDGAFFDEIGTVSADETTGKQITEAKFGFVSSQGNGKPLAGQKELSFRDLNPYSGSNIYRLKWTNSDGSEEYSDQVEVDFQLAGELFEIFPMPAKDQIKLRVGSQHTGKAKLNIRNLEGKLLISEEVDIEAGISLHALDISELQSGLFFVEMQMGRERWAGKLLVN